MTALGGTMSVIEASVLQWHTLHERGYFEGHRHYKTFEPVVYERVPFLHQFVQPKPNDIVLEIGCGYGRLMYTLAPLVRRIYGIDIHQAPLKKAQELLGGFDNVGISLYDGSHFPYTDDIFTLVYAMDMMQHVPREAVSHYVEEGLRVLCPGGRLLFQFPEFGKIKSRQKDIDLTTMREQTVPWTGAELIALAPMGFSGMITATKLPPKSVVLEMTK